MMIRDRIRELRRVPASQLAPNPNNWRTHPPAQLDALRGVLAEVGYAHSTTVVLDLFPQTHHVEGVSRFVRRRQNF